MDEILKSLWDLRTHPFFPKVDVGGDAFNQDILLNPLDPQADGRALSYYYDLYDWTYSQHIRGLSTKVAFEHFPSANDLADPKSLLVMITGRDNTGRESLRNLILHKIKEQTGHPPLIVKVELQGHTSADNAKIIANLFYVTYELEESKNPIPQLQQQYDRLTRDRGAGEANYSALFQTMKALVSRYCPRPLILLPTGVDRYDTWAAIYRLAGLLFDFIIVLTTNESNAKTANDILKSQNRNVALIGAKPLMANEARKYLQTRLEQERLGQMANPTPLVPFTEEALKELYERGTAVQKEKTAEPVALEIKRLNKILREAVNLHLDCLQRKKNLEALAPHERLIGADEIRKACDKVNQGIKG